MAKKAHQQKRHWLSRLSFGTVSLIFCALLLMSYLSILVDPAKAWFFTLFGLLYPLLIVAVTLLLIWALIRRAPIWKTLALCLLPSFLLAGRYVQLSGSADETPPTLKVVSYNVGLFAHGPDGMARMELADSVCAWLRRTGADIICLQEFRLPSDEDVERYLRKQFPGYDAEYYVLTGKLSHAGNVTLSRRPVVRKGKTAFEKSTNMALYTDVQLDSGVVRLYNCHFESYNISLSALVKRLGDEEEVERTGRKMRRSIRERPKQVAEVLKGVDAAPVQSVVLGDFNDTPISYTCFRLLRGRKDSFVRAGKGFGATFRSLWPLLRIDYILYPPALEAVSCEVRKVRYSDHYPILASYYETGRNPR